MQKDNTTLKQKTALRRSLLAQLPTPTCLLETHGGYGEVFKRVYSGLPRGVVIERNPDKSAVLARQRPSWLVIEGRAEQVLSTGCLRGFGVDVVDVDPYGSPWEVLTAVLGVVDAPLLGIAVNDGLRQRLRIKGGWNTKMLTDEVARYGNERLFAEYLEVCADKLSRLLSAAGYAMGWWAGYYAGRQGNMTHYACVATKLTPPAPAGGTAGAAAGCDSPPGGSLAGRA